MCSLIKATLEDAPDTPARAASLPSLKSCLLCSPLLGLELQSPRRRTGPSASSSDRKGDLLRHRWAAAGAAQPCEEVALRLLRHHFSPLSLVTARVLQAQKHSGQVSKCHGLKRAEQPLLQCFPVFFWWLWTGFTKSGWLRWMQSH